MFLLNYSGHLLSKEGMSKHSNNYYKNAVNQYMHKKNIMWHSVIMICLYLLITIITKIAKIKTNFRFNVLFSVILLKNKY